MSITSVSQNRSGTTTTVTAVSNLSAPVYYYWYIDGAFVGMTTAASKTFLLSPGDQTVISVLDSNSATFDWAGNAPVEYPARKTLVWVRSTDPNIARYQVQQQVNGGAWATIGLVNDDPRAWAFSYSTARLTDLSSYAWRVVPLDSAGNSGTPIALAAETIVRRPNAPKFVATYNGNASTMTFTAA